MSDTVLDKVSDKGPRMPFETISGWPHSALYIEVGPIIKQCTMRVDWFVWWVAGLIVVIGIGLVLFQLSPDVRLRRRRRKSHSRIISKARRPSVRFSVRSPKEK